MNIEDSIFFHSLALIDKYLESRSNYIDGDDLNLIGITSILISNKLENQNIDCIEDSMIKYFSRKDIRYELKQIYNFEFKMLDTLRFHILFPTVYSFYSFDVKRQRMNKKEKLLLKLSFINIDIIRNFKQSTIAKSIREIIKQDKELFGFIPSYDTDVIKCKICLIETLENEVELYKESL